MSTSGLQKLKFTLPAGAEDVKPVAAGRYLAVKEASEGTFEIALDDGPFVPWDVGMAFAVDANEGPFKLLKFRNTSGNPITFEVIVGTGRVYDQRLTVVADRVNGSIALDGADADAIAAPAGGVGIRGWLSGIYDRLKATGPLGAILANLETLATSILTGVASLDTRGQATKAASLPVTLASDQGALAVSAAQLPAALGQGTMAQSLPVVLPSNQTVGANVAQVGGTAVSVNGGNADAGTQRVVIASSGNGTLSVTASPQNTTQNALNSAASTNATSVKASAGNVYSIVAVNTNAAARYLKLYNKASAPTVGTDVPVMTIPLPPGEVVNVTAGAMGLRFSTGIAFALTTGAGDADTGAVAAGEIKVLTNYI